MRSFLNAAAMLLTLPGCAPQAEELLPIPASIRNASVVREVEVTIGRDAAARIAALDEQASESGRTGYAALPSRELIAETVKEVTRSWGLTTGRELKLLVEIDSVETVNAGAALLVGDRDRLAGSVFVRDAASGEPLGQLYIDVVNSHSGPIGLLLRGGGIREALAREFATHVARALTGRKNAPAR